MGYGPVLPWRNALQHTSRRCYSSTRNLSAACRAPSWTPTTLPASRFVSGRTVQLSRSGVSIFGSRDFSTSVSRRKEKPSGLSPEEETKEEVKKELDEKLRNEEDAGAKGRSSEPSPIPSAQDGKASSAGGGGSGESGSGGGDGGNKKRKAQGRELVKPSVPDVYPQVMAIPIAQRPLFPGFYKAITIRDPIVIAAVQELLKQGQSYVGAFLLKDPQSSQDVINDPSEVYDIGTFCQITGAFPAGTGEEKALQAVLYPHRRIKLSELLPPNRAEVNPSKGAAAPVSAGKATIEAVPAEEEVKPTQAEEKKGDVVASFEEPSVEKEKEKDSAPSSKTVASSGPTAFLHDWAVSLVNVDNLADEAFDKRSPTVRALVSEIVNTCKDIGNVNHLFRDHVSAFAMSQSAANIADEPAKLADFAAAVSGGEMEEAQSVLASLNIEQRLSKALEVIKKEYMNAQLSSKISKDVESKIQKRQREYWLMEQMKGIRRELGLESDGKDKLVEKFKEKAGKLAMPEPVKKVFDEELSKLAHLEPAASEFNVTRNYLDWLTQIPWGRRSAENFGIQHARGVLDEDHHGLKDVKDRILEFIAVGKLRGTVEGKILCMVGPPGVGKTSIGGLREKTVAARRAGATMVIFPSDCISDWLELPQNIKEGIEGKPVSWYSEVFDLVFPDIDAAQANTRWKKELAKPPKEERDDDDDGQN